MAELQYNGSSETCTDEGGNIFLKLSHAYDIISRDGDTVTFKWGVRFRSLPYSSGLATGTYNSVVIRPIIDGAEKNIYAMYSPGGAIHNETEEFIYASHNSPSGAYKGTDEGLPITSTRTVTGYGSGYIDMEVGTAWNEYYPDASLYTYKFSVPYPAADSYTITFYANGGTGGPSSQTKYQGYSFYLTTTKPTRTGYSFTGWNTKADGSGVSYSSGAAYNSDADLTLYAQGSATAPIFTPPTLYATETSIYGGSFSINTNSSISYSIDGGTNGTSLGSGTYGFSGSINGLTSNTYYTVFFKAVNNTTGQSTTNAVGITTYRYPYITGLSYSTIEAGSIQTISIYNPLGRTVTLKIAAVEDYDDNSVYKSGTFGSITTSSTSGSFTVPIQSIAEVVKNNGRARVYYQLKYNNVERSGRGAVVNFPASINPVIDTNILGNYFFKYADCAKETINGEDRSVSDFTGSDQILLRLHSKFRYYLDSDYSPVTTFYGASANTYYVTLNDKTMTYAQLKTYYYEDSEGASTTNADNAVVIPDSSVYRITVMVVDSRGKSASASLSIGTSSLQSPTPTITSIARDDGYGTKATLKLSGAGCSGMYGNQVGSYLRFYYRAVGDTAWSSCYLYNNTDGSVGYKSLTGTYSLDDITFDSGTAYEVRVYARNGLLSGRYSTTEILSLGTPLLFLDEAQNGVGINCFPDGKGLSVDGFGHFTGEITANNISASGHLVASSYIQTLSDLYVSGNAYITGDIYRNGNLSLDTGNISSYIGNYALPITGGLMQGPIELKTTGSHSNLILRRVDGYSGAGIGIDYQDREAVAIGTSRNNTAFRWHAGIDMTNMTNGMMLGITPDFEITKNSDGTKPQIYKGGKPVPAVYIQSSAPDSTNLQVGDIWFIL